jgi:two-component sensor histidine kinase
VITPRSPPVRAGEFAKADRHFARQVLFGLVLVAVVAVSGPLYAYRSDVSELRRQISTRIAREAQVHAEAVALHLRVLQAELERVAQRPEINFRDGTDLPEQELLDLTHGPHSALFKGGVLLVDAAGRLVISEPKQVTDSRVAEEAWFQRVLTQRAPLVDAFSPGSPTLVVAVPIIQEKAIIGVLAGLVDPATQELAGAQASGELVVVDAAGNFFVPASPPSWARSPDFFRVVEGVLAQPVSEPFELSGRRYFVTAKDVGSTGLRLALVADEDAVIAPARGRFLLQLSFVAVIQILTILLFSLYLRRSYGSFLVMESRAAEQEKLAALGSAASLIAHEVKNSLNGISAAATLLGQGDEPQLPLKTIRGQSDRLRHLASSLLHFGRPASAQLVSADLDRLVLDAVESLRVLPEADDVFVRTEVTETIRVQCDPMLLATALDNLIRNAMEAAVAAKDLGKLQDPTVRVSAGSSNGAAYVTVEDNAGGPPAAVEEHLFEPFVSGKPKGIGLGLSMARRAVEQQGGSLAFERTRSGCRFTVQLALGVS